jgi:mannose/cellobiose epimerase-like protein (N-acyl-D-glucosamine 2-epimerase family)
MTAEHLVPSGDKGVPQPAWLEAEPARLLEFARRAAHPRGGFAWLDATGSPVLDRPVETWVTCRMTHVFALASAAGRDTFRPLVDHGVSALRGSLRDAEHGGWYAAVDDTGPGSTDKRAYDHAFVVLAAASASVADAPGAAELLGEALTTFERHFWRESEGRVVDVWDRTWTHLEDYRGVNANMHAVEAMLAASDVLGDDVWAERAVRIVEHVVHDIARNHGWHLPEHFDASWQVRADYNQSDPAHPFRPYGVTIGHLLEWSRLALHVRHGLGAQAPAWLLDDARCLFDTAVRDGWAVDGAEGFVYTTDFEGRPVVSQRMHWVAAEAIATAYALQQATGEDQYADWFVRWCAYARAHLVDLEGGSWHHELDARNRPAHTVWEGKPDVYHAYQAAILPSLGPITSFAGAFLNAT